MLAEKMKERKQPRVRIYTRTEPAYAHRFLERQ